MGTHKELEVWQQSMELVEALYALTKNFPKEELYGFTSQIRRSAISVPSNIAEGSARKGNKENIQFLYVALRSLAELETQLLISKRLQYLADDACLESLEVIRRKLLNYIKYCKTL
ncbi:MAG: four helix bundle protein [Luteibaculum sp.]